MTVSQAAVLALSASRPSLATLLRAVRLRRRAVRALAAAAAAARAEAAGGGGGAREAGLLSFEEEEEDTDEMVRGRISALAPSNPHSARPRASRSSAPPGRLSASPGSSPARAAHTGLHSLPHAARGPPPQGRPPPPAAQAFSPESLYAGALLREVVRDMRPTVLAGWLPIAGERLQGNSFVKGFSGCHP